MSIPVEMLWLLFGAFVGAGIDELRHWYHRRQERLEKEQNARQEQIQRLRSEKGHALDSLKNAVSRHLDEIDHWEGTTESGQVVIGAGILAMELREYKRLHGDLLSQEGLGLVNNLIIELDRVSTFHGDDLWAAIRRSKALSGKVIGEVDRLTQESSDVALR